MTDRPQKEDRLGRFEEVDQVRRPEEVSTYFPYEGGGILIPSQFTSHRLKLGKEPTFVRFHFLDTTNNTDVFLTNTRT